jgi:hypothetical protein
MTPARPAPCHGKRAGRSFASHCYTCARRDEDATFTIIPNFHANYVGGITVVQCYDHLPGAVHDAASVGHLTRKVCDTTPQDETRRYRWGMVLGVAVLAVAAALVSVAASAQTCKWEPATDPFRGDQAAAVMALQEIPLSERIQLADMVRQQYAWRRVYVTRDSVDAGRLADMRSMNWGNGRVCPGAVDRSAWPVGRHESGRAYSVGRWAVLVMDSCRNVALATDTYAMPVPAPETRETVREGYRGGLGSLGVSAAPEPGSLALAVLALAGVALSRGRK